MDATREEECVRMAQNTIIILSESFSSDDSLETLYVESSGSSRKIPTKPVISYNRSSTFRPHCHQMTCRKHFWMTHLIHVEKQKPTKHLTYYIELNPNSMNFFLYDFLDGYDTSDKIFDRDSFCTLFVLVYYQMILHGTIFFSFFHIR